MVAGIRKSFFLMIHFYHDYFSDASMYDAPKMMQDNKRSWVISHIGLAASPDFAPYAVQQTLADQIQ